MLPIIRWTINPYYFILFISRLCLLSVFLSSSCFLQSQPRQSWVLLWNWSEAINEKVPSLSLVSHYPIAAWLKQKVKTQQSPRLAGRLMIPFRCNFQLPPRNYGACSQLLPLAPDTLWCRSSTEYDLPFMITILKWQGEETYQSQRSNLNLCIWISLSRSGSPTWCPCAPGRPQGPHEAPTEHIFKIAQVTMELHPKLYLTVLFSLKYYHLYWCWIKMDILNNKG